MEWTFSRGSARRSARRKGQSRSTDLLPRRERTRVPRASSQRSPRRAGPTTPRRSERRHEGRSRTGRVLLPEVRVRSVLPVLRRRQPSSPPEVPALRKPREYNRRQWSFFLRRWIAFRLRLFMGQPAVQTRCVRMDAVESFEPLSLLRIDTREVRGKARGERVGDIFT